MVPKVAQMEERISGKRATARKADKGRRNVARENSRPVGRVERQDTQQRGVGKVATRICMPLMRKARNTLKKQMTVKRTCKHGACWKKARMNSRKRWSANGKNKRCREPTKLHRPAWKAVTTLKQKNSLK